MRILTIHISRVMPAAKIIENKNYEKVEELISPRGTKRIVKTGNEIGYFMKEIIC